MVPSEAGKEISEEFGGEAGSGSYPYSEVHGSF